MRALFTRFVEAVLLREASTRAVGLIRVLLALLIWSRWANETQPFRDMSPERLLLSVAFYASTACMFFGVASRLSTLLTGVVLAWMVYGFGELGGVETWTHHHTHLLANATLILALTPCDRSFSLDRWWALRAAAAGGPPAPPERGPVYGQVLLALQVSTLYLWSAVDKTTIGFLSGDRLEHLFHGLYWGSDPLEMPLLDLGFAAAGVAVVLLEYLLPFGLFVRRWQPVLIPVGLALHAAFYTLLPVGTFSMTMWALYLAYLDPDDVHRWIDRMLGTSPDPASTLGVPAEASPPE